MLEHVTLMPRVPPLRQLVGVLAMCDDVTRVPACTCSRQLARLQRKLRGPQQHPWTKATPAPRESSLQTVCYGPGQGRHSWP